MASSRSSTRADGPRAPVVRAVAAWLDALPATGSPVAFALSGGRDSIVLLEAAAAGTRSVASHIPAHTDVAATTGATHLVPADAAPHHLASTIAEAADHPRPTAAVASWPEVADRTAELYEDVLRAHPAGTPRVGGGARPPA